MLDSDHILLRLRLFRWRIFMRSCLGRSRHSRISFGIALLVVCLSTLASLWRQRTWLVPFIDHRAGIACGLVSALLLLISTIFGRRAVLTARRDLADPWLAVLPWSERQRKRAVLLSCLPPFGVALAQSLAIALLAGALIRPTAIPLLCMACLMLSGAGFACGAAIFPTRSHIKGRSEENMAQPSMQLAWVDQVRPRWLGNWAIEGRGGRLLRLWFGLLATVGALGIAGSLETGTAVPGVMIGMVGGHLVFLAAIRARPLRADALRLLPVSFPRAVWGVVRLPLLLSLGWMLIPDAGAFAAAPGDLAPAGSLAGLLLLDALAGLSTLWLADAPAAALLLHCTVLLLGLQYWAKLGLSEIVLLIGLAAFLWRGARRRFIEGSHRRAARHS